MAVPRRTAVATMAKASLGWHVVLKKPVEVHPTRTLFLVEGDSMPDFGFEAGRQIGLRLPLAQEGLQSLIVFGVHDGLDDYGIAAQKREIAPSAGHGFARQMDVKRLQLSRQTAVAGAGMPRSIGRLQTTTCGWSVPACATVGPELPTGNRPWS
jgi:hypothetical protein